MSIRISTTHRSGFTLVELLVVAGIIAFGALMLSPALARTGSVAKAIQCRNNLRQLTAAWSAYAADNGDRLVAASTAISGRPAWVSGLMDYSSGNPSNWDVTRDIAKSPLWPYVGRDSALFRCPADPSCVLLNGVSTPRVRSISMSQVFGQGEWLDGSYNPGQRTWRTYAKAGDVMVPAKTFLFIDEHPGSINDGFFGVACTGATQPATARIIDFPASYHDNGACGMSFADGHAGAHKWLGSTIKPPFTGDYLALNVPAGDSWADIAWLAQNTTVRR
jgi:prepilin-type N-terminal cleavage/methylation domain-containing protein/prepilin-type processing-associated H-X9-DG protein